MWRIILLLIFALVEIPCPVILIRGTQHRKLLNNINNKKDSIFHVNGEVEDNLRRYFYMKEQSSALHRTVIQADKKFTPLKLADREYKPLSDTALEEQILKWQSEPLHGKYIYR